jgi:HAD superfamily hydrolase (TIGR01509 family)
VRAAELDAVTIDVYGTLMTIVDPVSALHVLLPEHDPESIERAFRLESAFYEEHSSEGSDEHTLAHLHERSVTVFNEALGSALAPAAYAGAFEFELLPRVREALDTLRGLGLSLAVVANWDISVTWRLEKAGIASFFSVVIPAARKPAPDAIHEALERLAVHPSRALHIGDSDTDEQAARAAGVHFLPAPFPEAVASLA